MFHLFIAELYVKIKKCGVVGTPCDFPDGDDIIIDPVELFIYYIQCTRNTLCKHLELRGKKR